MSLLCWNCRGLGGRSAVPNIRDLVTRLKPQVISLIETKIYSSERWQNVRCRIGFQHCFWVSAVGNSGGLAVMWNPGTDLTIVNYSPVHIDFVLMLGEPV